MPEPQRGAGPDGRLRSFTHQGRVMGRFEFSEGGRTFTCERGSSPATPGTQWWWVNVSGDGQRYAAFVSKSGDSRANVQPRILAYYTQLLADRARPAIPRSSFGRPRQAPQPAAATETSATPGS